MPEVARGAGPPAAVLPDVLGRVLPDRLLEEHEPAPEARLLHLGRSPVGGPGSVRLRPEDVVCSYNGHGLDGEGQFLGAIVNQVFLGRTVRMEVKLKGGGQVTVALPKRDAMANEFRLGGEVEVSLEAFRVFPSYAD